MMDWGIFCIGFAAGATTILVVATWFLWWVSYLPDPPLPLGVKQMRAKGDILASHAVYLNPDGTVSDSWGPPVDVGQSAAPLLQFQWEPDGRDA